MRDDTHSQCSGAFFLTRNGYNFKSTDQFETTAFDISLSNKFSIVKWLLLNESLFVINLIFDLTFVIMIFDLVFECMLLLLLLLISFKNNSTYWNTISIHSFWIRSSKYFSNIDFIWIMGLQIIRRNRSRIWVKTI